MTTDNQSKPMKRATTYRGRRLRAISTTVGLCECGHLIGVDLLAGDGNIIAHGHFEIAEAEQFAAHMNKLIAGLKAKLAN